MFTMKKFATLAIAGFLGASMLACSDDKEDDASSSSVTPSSSSAPPPPADWTSADITGAGWTKKATVTLYGADNNAGGSFVDLDVFANGTAALPVVYTASTVAANKNKVDLIFDGSSIYTPQACLAAYAATTGCPQLFQTLMSGYVGEKDPDDPADPDFYPSVLVRSNDIQPTKSKTEVAAIFNAALNAKQTILNTAVTPRPGGIYYVRTTNLYGVLILVGGGIYGAGATGTTLTLVVGN